MVEAELASEVSGGKSAGWSWQAGHHHTTEAAYSAASSREAQPRHDQYR